jgi:hypothetical protein
MKHVLIAMVVLLVGGMAHAKKTCTDQPKEMWMSEADFKKNVEERGDKVEVYFNPVDATVVKQEMD